MAEYPTLSKLYPQPRPAVRLVGLLGHARAGKDTVAARLTGHYGFTRRAFADALKRTMYDLDPIVYYQQKMDGPIPVGLAELVDALGWEAAKDIPEVRRLLQAHGVAIRTYVDPDVWVNAVMAQVDAGTASRTVITDVRFPNEYNAIRRRGGLLVRVVREGAEGNGHISETALDHHPVDRVIVNNGTLDDLARRLDAVLGKDISA